MKKFAYKKATNLDEALNFIDNEDCRILAGGTNIMLKIKHSTVAPCVLLDISSTRELSYIKDEGDVIKIGACTKLSDIIENKMLQKAALSLIEVASEIGSREVRNMGTVGGNICSVKANCGTCFLPGCRGMTGDRSVRPCSNASYADLLLPFLAYDAEVKIKSAHTEHSANIRHFLKSHGNTVLRTNEIVTEVSFKKPRLCGWSYVRFRYPRSMGLPFLNVIGHAHNGVVDLTIGGSTRGLYKFENIKCDFLYEAANEISFVDCLVFSHDYRTKIANALMREAIIKAMEDLSR
jgi:CO/xanthine dehydrogenase FAD-binding subunit